MGYDCRAGVSLLLRENPYGVFSCYQGFISLLYAIRRFLSIEKTIISSQYPVGVFY